VGVREGREGKLCPRGDPLALQGFGRRKPHPSLSRSVVLVAPDITLEGGENRKN